MAVEWFPVRDSGVDRELGFDHAEIVAAAIERLRGKAEYTSLPAYLLPETFTLTELQQAYELVLGRPVDKSGFRTRVRAAGLVVEAEGMRTGATRPAQLYRIRSPGTLTFFPRTFSPRKE